MEMLRTCQQIRHGQQTVVHGEILQGHEVLDATLQRLAKNVAALGIRTVQERRDEPVAAVEICLPAYEVILVYPRDMPQRGTREGYRAVSGCPCPKAILGVIPLDK